MTNDKMKLRIEHLKMNGFFNPQSLKFISHWALDISD